MRRRIVLTGASAALLLALAGCSAKSETARGGGGGVSGGDRTTSRSAEARPDFPFEKGDVKIADFVDAVLEAQKGLTSYTVHMRSQTPAGDLLVTSEYEKVDGVERSHTVIKNGETNVEQIFIGDQGYDKGEDGTWSKAEGATAGVGADESLEMFSKAIRSAKYLGLDEHGHKFDLVMDLSAATGKEGQSLPAEMWLDEKLRMVRSEYTFDAGGDEGESVNVTTRDGFGESYGIKAPI